jgi:hypothetical protein
MTPLTLLTSPSLDTAGDVYTNRASTSFWFDDGNIILAAVDGATHLRHLFRVHKSVLSLHSSVFRTALDSTNLVEAELAVSAEMQYDGLPVLKIYDDPHDVNILLESLYQPECVINPVCYAYAPIETYASTCA